MSLSNYDTWKADEPACESTDPHEPCEREIARLESACSISFAELHALVAGWLPGQTFFIGVNVQHAEDRWGRRDIITWSISYAFNIDANSCELIHAPTAAEAYAQLRAAVPAPQNPLANVGDLPW